MDYLFISGVSCLASLLTFFSGFGLGTVLTPFYGIFFPLHLAIMMTAAVHLVNSASKALLLRQYIDWNFVKTFGGVSVISSAFGAWCLLKSVKMEALYTYELGGHIHTITPTKLLVATLLLFFVLWERSQGFKNFALPKQWFLVGGAASGFLGGFSGHQGALRTVVLRSAKFSKETLIATSASVALGIDLLRISIYLFSFTEDYRLEQPHWVSAGITGAFIGTFIGKSMLSTMSDTSFEKWISATLILFSLALGAGMIGQ